MAGALSALVLLGSLGMALARGQPWALRQPVALSTLTIAGADLSIDVPREAWGRIVRSSDGRASHLSVGSPLADPVLVRITTIPEGPGVPGPEEHLRHHADDTRPGGRRLDFKQWNGLPMATLDGRSRAGGLYGRRALLRGGRRVDIEVIAEPELPLRWRAAHLQILESLRAE